MASILNVDQIGHSTSGTTGLEIDSSGNVTVSNSLTSPVVGQELILEFPAGAAPSGSFTHYNNGAIQTNDASHLNKRVPCNLTVTKMFLYVNGALSSGSSQVKLMKNGNSTTMHTISVGTGTSAFDASPNASFTAGDRIGIKIEGSGASAAWYNVTLLCRRDA